MGLPRAEPFRLEALAYRAGRSLPFPEGPLLRRGRLGRHLIVERLGPTPVSPVKEKRAGLGALTSSSCRSRGARARGAVVSFARTHCFHECRPSRACCARIRLRSHHVATFWVSDRPRSFLRLGSGSRSRAILPALSVHDVTRGSDPGELGPPPRRAFTPRSARARSALELRARVGAARRRPRSFRPMSAAHGCCFQDDRPCLGARRIDVPTMRELRGFTPRCSLRRTVGSRSGCCLPRSPFRRRTSDASSLAGSPGRAVSTGVGPRSLARSQVVTRKPRPAPPSRVNGLLVLLGPEAPSSLSSLSAWIAGFSPGSATRSGRSRGPVPFETRPHERRTRASAVSTDPRGTTRAPNPLGVAPRSFRNAAPRAA